MARASSASQQRQLSATEELEKLEQSITLTLQEIDHNFSRAHRIVTSSILPIVEGYAAHSRDVWEGSKFWKQFFESSANVSLSGYEDQSLQQSHLPDETVTETEDSSATHSHTTLETSETYSTPSAQHISTDSSHDLDISNMTLSPSKSSTPRPSSKQRRNDTYSESTPAQFAEYPSPYEALRQEVNQTVVDTTSITDAARFDETQQLAPSTPGAQTRLDPSQYETTPQSSPFLPAPPAQPTPVRPSTTRKKTDPLLHRILDKNYRVQATPLTTRKHTSTTTPATSQRTTRRLFDSSPMSSPEVPAPQLNTALFSPQRPTATTRGGPRTPGVSVLAPVRGKRAVQNQSQAEKPAQKQVAAERTLQPSRSSGLGSGIPQNDNNNWDIDSSDEDDSVLPFGSPPKTMQFHVPQNRLLKTPAKEATRLIVDSILSTAGLTGHRNATTGKLELTEDDLDFELDTDPEDDNLDQHNNNRQYASENGYAHGQGPGHGHDKGLITPGPSGDQFRYPNGGHGGGGGGHGHGDTDGRAEYYGKDDEITEERSPTVVRPAMVEDETF